MGRDSLLSGVFGLVLLGTLARQIPALSASRLLAWDAVGILPGFAFFAPNPGNRDYVLVYRSYADGRGSAWRDPFAIRARRRSTMFWNPDKRLRKAVIDISGSLAKDVVALGAQDPRLMLSISYLLMLEFVSGLVDGTGATHVQFAILTSAADPARSNPSVELFFSSARHELDR